MLELTCDERKTMQDLAPRLQHLDDRIFAPLDRENFHKVCQLPQMVAAGRKDASWRMADRMSE